MTVDQLSLFGVLFAVFVLFVWGRWRYDLVAFVALMTSVLIGLVPSEQAFTGFSHAAVVTVAAVLVISRGLAVSGAIDRISQFVVPATEKLFLQIGVMASFSAILSAVMNNVAALALLIPSTLESAKKTNRSPSLLLMPLSFASILGGLITLIGTPPNIVIASYRADALGSPYGMFDFAPVGLVVAAVGVMFLATVGWRLLPKDRQAQAAPDELFKIEGYIAEVIISEGSEAIEKNLEELRDIAETFDIQIAGLIRNHQKLMQPAHRATAQEKDILILETGPKELDAFAHKLGLEIKGDANNDRSKLSSENTVLLEAILAPDSRMVGRESGAMRLRSRYGLNLLGISRQGQAIRKRLHKTVLKAGDILLLQGDPGTAPATLERLKLLPLAERGFQMGKRSHAVVAVGLLAGAVALAATGLFSLTIALSLAALGMVGFSIVPLRDIYDTIDWPVIVLVAAMIPIGGALETTGATDLIANEILSLSSGYSPVVVLAILFLVTMTLSDLMNNVATAVMMAPIAVSLAGALNANPDSFLMAVAVSASCAFLTPIGHKNNALIMGPGGYRFGDYWRMGLPLEIIITAVALPMILLVWPL